MEFKMEKAMENTAETVMGASRQERDFSDEGSLGMLGEIHGDCSGQNCQSVLHRPSSECKSPSDGDFEILKKCLEPTDEMTLSPPLPSPSIFWRATPPAKLTPTASIPTVSAPTVLYSNSLSSKTSSSEISSPLNVCSKNLNQPEDELVEVFDYYLTRQANDCSTGEPNYSTTESEFNSSDSESTIICSELSHISLIEPEEKFEVLPHVVERTYASSDSFCSESTSHGSESTISEDAAGGSENSEISESSGESSYSLDSEIMHRNNQILHWVLTGERKAFSTHSIASSYTLCSGAIETLPSEEGEGEGDGKVATNESTSHVKDRTSDVSVGKIGDVDINCEKEVVEDSQSVAGVDIDGVKEVVEDSESVASMDIDCEKEVVEDSQSVAAIDEQRHASWKSCDRAEKEWRPENREESSSADEVTAGKISDSTQDTTSSSESTDCIDVKTLERRRMQRVSKKRDMLRKVGQLLRRCFGMSRKSSSL